MALGALQFAMAAVDAGQVTNRGVLDHELRRIEVFSQSGFDIEELPPPKIVLEMLLE
jgi:hypothetical protein